MWRLCIFRINGPSDPPLMHRRPTVDRYGLVTRFTATTLCLLLTLGSTALHAELIGISVTPHSFSPNLKWRRPPNPELGARVELFLRNSTDRAVTLSRDSNLLFDASAPAELLANREWSWHSTPHSWPAESTDLPPNALTVFALNGRRNSWGVNSRHQLQLEKNRFEFAIDPPDTWLSAITFLGDDNDVLPTQMFVHVANQSARPARIKSCRRWLPQPGQSVHVFHPHAELERCKYFSDATIEPGDKGGFRVACDPLPLTYVVVQVAIVRDDGREQSLWAHLKIKTETFDMSGGWIASAINGRNSLTIEPYLKTLKRMHINCGQIGEVSGYTDNAELYRKYPFKFFSRMQPIERYDNDQVLPNVHAVEFLGEPQYGGGRPVPPQEVWDALRPYESSRLPTSVTYSEERSWRYFAGVSDYPHYDAYRVTAPSADWWRDYDRWNGQRIGWGAPLETIGDMTRSLREHHRPKPIAYWSQGAHSGWRGRSRRSSPTPDELRSQAYHGLAHRITSLYWFNLSLKSLVTFPDLIEPITRVNRELHLLDEILLRGDAYEYRRVFVDNVGDLDVSSVVSDTTAALFAIDLSYQIDQEQRVFSFQESKPIEVHFRLPSWLQEPVAIFRLDADGTHQVDYRHNHRKLVIRDRIHVAGIYLATIDSTLRDRLHDELTQLIAAENAVEFDPGKVETDLQTLKSYLD